MPTWPSAAKRLQPAAIHMRMNSLAPMLGTMLMSAALARMSFLRMSHMPVEMPAAMKVMRPEMRAKRAIGMDTRRE